MYSTPVLGFLLSFECYKFMSPFLVLSPACSYCQSIFLFTSFQINVNQTFQKRVMKISVVTLQYSYSISFIFTTSVSPNINLH